MIIKKRTLAIPALTVLLTLPAHSASLDLGSRNLVSENNQNFNISVFDGAAGYDNTGTLTTNPPLVTTTIGDGTALSYNFLHSPGDAIASYASGGSRTPLPTVPAANINGTGEQWSNVWTTTDPVGFTTTKDFNNGTVANTFARAANVTGSIDISGLTSGTVYVPHGTYINQWNVTLTMTGAGQPDIVAFDAQTVNGPGTNLGWISDFNFTTDSLYDSIGYTYTNADTDGSRARFAGVILDGVAVPEPAGAALLGLAGFGLMLRRRR